MGSENIQIAINQIDKGLFDNDLTTDDIIGAIIEEHNGARRPTDRYVPETIQPEVDLHGYRVKLFSARKRTPPKWQDFWEPIVPPDAALIHGQNLTLSFVAFIASEANIFAITGGLAYFVIQNFMDHGFGIKLLTKLISNETKAIKGLQDRGLTGAVISNTKFFRGNYKLADEEQFGKIYKGLQVALEAQLCQELGFSPDEIRDSAGCIAKSSFKLNKAIGFSRLLSILQEIEQLLVRPALFTLNKARQVSNQAGYKDKRLLAQLNESLTETIYTAYLQDNELDFDFFHPEYEKYLTADNYRVFKGRFENQSLDFPELTNFNALLDALRQADIIDSSSAERFSAELKKFNVKSIDADGNTLTHGPITKHIHCELALNAETFFRVDGDWYELQSDFIDELNSECHRILDDCLDTNLLNIPWDVLQSSEEAYIGNYVGLTRHWAFHKIKPSNIEPCDLLIETDDQLVFVHIKKGFNNLMRDLSAQIHISARHLHEDIKTNSFSFVRAMYEASVGQINSTDNFLRLAAEHLQTTSAEDFVQMLSPPRKMVFCLAFVDDAIANRSITEIQRFGSNIAKFAIVELYKKLKLEGLDLKIAQIPRA